MRDFRLTEKEKNALKVIKNEIGYAQYTPLLSPLKKELEENITSSEDLLRSIGYGDQLDNIIVEKKPEPKKNIVIRPWEDLLKDANEQIEANVDFYDIFTSAEIEANRLYIERLNEDFNALHRLDAIDYTICSTFGILAAVIDIILVGIPQKTPDGLKAGPLSNYIRDLFEKRFSPEEMEKLGGKASYKTPFDAQDNRNTTVDIAGLSSYYHRLLSLGHDPLLALIVGVLDTLNGTMTTIDKQGKIVTQVMDVYSDRIENNIIDAIKKVFRHLKSDITTSMGLPAPLMGLFNLLQFGSIGEEHQTIAQIVQGMYYEGYDFIHFCSMSIPVMIIEMGVRISYCIKRVKEGHSLKESIPITANRHKRPKLGTMLFISHSIATAVNTGKVYFTQNPLSINYPQWMAFAKYTFQQLKWVLKDKPEMRHKYVMGYINEEWDSLYESIDQLWESVSNEYTVVYE